MVISARYKAEEVWYWIIGEEKKLPNEIWYNINWEITKDAAAVENANNQTTTGMANQIPWINEPKLKADTSIYWIWWWGSLSSYWFFYYNSPDRISSFERIVNWTEVQQSGWYTMWTYWIKVPNAWLYFVNLYAEPSSALTSSFEVDVINWNTSDPFFEISSPIWNHIAASWVQYIRATDYIEIWVEASSSVYIEFYLYIQKIA